MPKYAKEDLLTRLIDRLTSSPKATEINRDPDNMVLVVRKIGPLTITSQTDITAHEYQRAYLGKKHLFTHLRPIDAVAINVPEGTEVKTAVSVSTSVPQRRMLTRDWLFTGHHTQENARDYLQTRYDKSRTKDLTRITPKS